MKTYDIDRIYIDAMNKLYYYFLTEGEGYELYR